MSNTTNKSLIKPANNSDINTWDVPVNGNMDSLDAILGTAYPITITSSDATLNQTQANNLSFAVTGAITGNRQIILPAIGGFWFVSNETTGAFTVTVIISGGTGAVCPQGFVTPVYADGTNVYAGAPIPTNSVDNTKLAQMASGTVKANLGGSPANATDATLSALATALGPFLNVPTVTGQVAYFPATAAPNGWLVCDGSVISRTTYASLWTFANASGNIVADGSWSASTTPGSFSSGDGTTTFRIPDLRGIFIRDWDDGAGIDPGRGIGTYQADSFASHTHTFQTNQTGTSGTAGPAGSTSNPTATITTSATGGSETRPKNAALLVCIKT